MAFDSSLGTKADQNLLQQLETQHATGDAVQAWFRLKSDPLSQASGAQETTTVANSLVQRVKEHLGEEAESFKILPNLNSFMVSARPAFVRELIHQPEVESARSTNVPGFGLIQPVKSEPVEVGPGRTMTSVRSRRKAPRPKGHGR
jgi:hypothetical protein